MLHWFAWLVARLVYRLRVLGGSNLPASGPALILCNHVSYVDWLVLMAASPRPIHFLIDSTFVNNRWYGFILRWVGVIPIDRKVGPKSLMQSFSAVSAALADGRIVCVFPEGAPTRTGAMLPFKRGFEKLAQISPIPLVPTYIDQLWGSRFSYKHGALFWKRSDRGPYPVTVGFGPSLPNHTPAAQVRQAVLELAAECAIARVPETLPAHRQFVRIAAAHTKRRCLIDTNADPVRHLNTGEVLTGAICLANWLRPHLHREPMVGVWLPSSVGGVLANLALALLGKTSVNLNYTAGSASVQSAAKQCQLKFVLTSRKFLARMPVDLPGVLAIHLEDALTEITPKQKKSAYLKVKFLPGWLLDRILGLSWHRSSDTCTVIFSSGSTGEPKGIVLTHGNIASNVEAFADYVQLGKRDRVLGILPFFHSFGYTVTMWGALLAGATALYHPDPRAAKEVGELCRTHGCTLMAATATFLRMYLRRCQPEDFKTMRLLVCGAEKLPPDLIQEFKAKFGVQPLEGYGCTELSPVVSVNIPDVEVNRVHQVSCKIGTIGHPLPGVAWRIADPDTFAPKLPGEEGLLLVTGPNMMKGYLGREDLNCKAMYAGWYITGDMGRMDTDGFVTLTGRLSRFAKIGGEMVPLELIEEHLHKILGTADRVLAVTAVPDPKRGERLVVLYLPLPGMSLRQLLDQLRDVGLPNLWQPDERDFVAVPELPVLGTGKLDLQGIRRLALERAGGAVKA